MSQIKPNSTSFLKEFFTLMLPTLLGNLLVVGMTLSDHVMTTALGGAETGGIFYANQLFLIYSYLVTGIEAALAITGAQSVGNGSKKSFQTMLSPAIFCTLTLSLLATIICILMPKVLISLFTGNGDAIGYGVRYLRIIALSFIPFSLSRMLISAARCHGRAMPSFCSAATALTSNVLLNALFIYVFDLGVVGIGASTLIARSAELIVAMISVRRSLGGEIKLSALLSLSASGVKSFLRALLPLLLGQLVWSASNLFSSTVISRSLGELSSAWGVTASLSSLAYTLMNATSSSAGVLVSRAVGRGDEDAREYASGRSTDRRTIPPLCTSSKPQFSFGAKGCAIHARPSHRFCLGEVISFSQKLFLLTSLLSFVLIFALREPFIALYRLSSPDAAAAREMMGVLAITFAATAYSAAALFGIVKSAGGIWSVILTDAFCFFALTLPLGLALFGSGASGATLLFALRLEHIVKCPIAYGMIRRGRFVKRLTKAT
ncbi:MAG: MATE family efflux transporter [Clostridia bacterium]|nr:MATE family efflux transporter [Clostridia bacterium]